VSGVACGTFFQSPGLRRPLARPLMQWSASAPLSFYGLAWYFTYELARMFEDLRFLLGAALHAFKR
jgi:hypothetical protein